MSNYKLNEELIDKQFAYIIKKFKQSKYTRYEISNWCIDNKYRSQHNLEYWHTKQWKALCYGAYGFEDMNYYYFVKDKKISHMYSKKEYYQHLLIMGLRLIEGLDLKNQNNSDAWNYFKDRINTNLYVIKNNKVILKNINLLDDVLLNII